MNTGVEVCGVFVVVETWSEYHNNMFPNAVLAQQIDDVATKAAMSFEPSPDDDPATIAIQQQAVRRRAAAFARAFSAHLQRLQGDAAAYGRLGLAELFELREECLREFGFHDVYKYVLGGVIGGVLFLMGCMPSQSIYPTQAAEIEGKPCCPRGIA